MLAVSKTLWKLSCQSVGVCVLDCDLFNEVFESFSFIWPVYSPSDPRRYHVMKCKGQELRTLHK